ncbi:MAG: type II secretion system protein [Phycisphaerae bacterium]
MRKKKGFTLVELLVVVSIIAMLMSILIPSLGRARELARRSVCGSQLKQINVGIASYAMKNNGAMLNIKQMNSSDEEFHPFVAYRINEPINSSNTKFWAYRFGCLYDNRIIEDPKVFYCPSNKNEDRQYASYINPGPWGSLPQEYNTTADNQWVRVGYEYFPVAKNFKRSPFTGAPETLATNFDRLDAYLPIATDVLRTKASMSHMNRGTCGVNAAYPDGSVAFCNNQDTFSDNLRLPPGVGLPGGLWDADLREKKKTVIYSIYYYRFLAISDPFHPSLVRSR